MRAYRIRCDSSGCLRSDAQRWQLRTVRQDARTQRDAEHQERQALISERDTLAGQLADAQRQHQHVAAHVAELEKKLAESQQARATLGRLVLENNAEAAKWKELHSGMHRAVQGLSQRVRMQQETIEALEVQPSRRGNRGTASARGAGRQTATVGMPIHVAWSNSGSTPAAASNERQRAKLQTDLDRTAQALTAERTRTAHLTDQLATCKSNLATAENTMVTLRQELTAQERNTTEARQAVDAMQARLTEQAAQHASRDEERERQLVRYARDITALQGKLEAAEKSAQFWKDPQVMAGVVSAIKSVGGVAEDLVRQHYNLPPKERANLAQPQAMSVSVSPPGTAPSPASSPSVAPPTAEQVKAPQRPFTDENGKNLYHPYNKTNTLIGQAKARREGR